jgi:hypothetical protein
VLEVAVMKQLKKIALAIMVCITIHASMLLTQAAADVKVTVTFAAGGVACGFYLFFAYASGFTADWQNTQFNSPALLNYSAGSWQVKPPLLLFIGDNNKNSISYAEIIRIRF